MTRSTSHRRLRRALLAVAGVIGLVPGVGCVSLPVHRSLIGGELAAELKRRPGPPGMGQREIAEPCRPKQRIRVVDADGRPVAGASVVATQTTSEHASEETLAEWRYAADPVITDAHGEATVCAPGELFPEPEWNGIGGGFTFRDSGSITVTSGGTSTTVAMRGAPHTNVLIFVVGAKP